MNQAYLDPNNYTFAGSTTVRSGRDLTIPDSILLSQTMLIKWQIRNLAKGATIEQIPPATLTAILEIPGMGVLDRSDAQISPSQQGKDVVQIWTIDPSLPYKITFSGASDLVTNSILEFYSSSIEEDYQYMGVSNPASIDPAAFQAALTGNNEALAQAVGASTGAAVQQAMANQVIAAESKTSTTRAVVVKMWTGNISDHLIVPADLTRMGLSAAHPGELISSYNTSTVYIAIGDPTGRDNTRYEYAMTAGGSYIVDSERDTLPTYMWLQPSRSPAEATITVTEYFLTLPAV